MKVKEKAIEAQNKCCKRLYKTDDRKCDIGDKDEFQ